MTTAMQAALLHARKELNAQLQGREWDMEGMTCSTELLADGQTLALRLLLADGTRLETSIHDFNTLLQDNPALH